MTTAAAHRIHDGADPAEPSCWPALKGFKAVENFVSDLVVTKEIQIKSAIGVTSSGYKAAVLKKGQWGATTEFKINLTAPVTQGTVAAHAEIINLSRTQAVVRIDIVNEGRRAAIAQGTVTIRDPR